jgi:hypothetical protein
MRVAAAHATHLHFAVFIAAPFQLLINLPLIDLPHSYDGRIATSRTGIQPQLTSKFKSIATGRILSLMGIRHGKSLCCQLEDAGAPATAHADCIPMKGFRVGPAHSRTREKGKARRTALPSLASFFDRSQVHTLVNLRLWIDPKV